MKRRQFLTGSLAGATAFSIVKPGQVRGAEANAKIRLGIIGGGHRGQWLGTFFLEHGGYVINACADYFAERANEAGDKLQVPAGNRFSGLHGYQRLLDSGVDAVAIESPPYFHPEQAAAAVAAGKHVFCAKPVAVDVPGCNTIAESGRQATAKKLVFLVDFQTRATEFYIEAIKRIHAGGIGDIAYGEAIYHGGAPFTNHHAALRAEPNNPEVRLRAWGLDRILSGDIVTEQFIHTLDVMNWVMPRPPQSAFAGCGLRAREKIGTCADHFTALMKYADGASFTFSGMQFNNHGSQPMGIRVRAFGQKGVFESQYGGNVMIRGTAETFYRGGDCRGIGAEGPKTNIATFHECIVAGRCDNPTVAPSVRSNLITLLVRTAAYTGEAVTWEKMLAKNEKLEADLRGLKT
jgi:myo-inositol 2-dehydrogenase/D-chiro-inositol 1-dehydrogenase